MAEQDAKIEFVSLPCPVRPRKIAAQNIVLRLRKRETIGCSFPGTHVLNARQFYQNVFPNFTVVNVEKPPCFLRKFSPDGRFLIAFSADQTSIEVYEYQGASAAADLLADLRGEYVGHKNDDRTFHIRNNIFRRFFKVFLNFNHFVEPFSNSNIPILHFSANKVDFQIFSEAKKKQLQIIWISCPLFIRNTKFF